MNLPELCIRRPVMTTLLTAAVCIFGVMAYRLLPVSDLPTVDFPTIVVNATLPGATPETMSSAVATVLEQQFSTIAGIDSMTSSSGTGSTQNHVCNSRFERNIDAAAQDVQASIAAVQRRLPQDMPSPPSLRKTNPADQPVLFLALSFAHAAAVGGGRICRDDRWPSASPAWMVFRKCRCLARKNTRCASASIPGCWPVVALRSTKCARGAQCP